MYIFIYVDAEIVDQPYMKNNKNMKKINKAKLLKRLKTKALRLWSLCIRGRDKKCIVCGTTEDLQAHHAIVRAALSLWTRFELTNGVTLCKYHHILQLHRFADKDTIEIYLKYLNDHVSQEEQIRLKQLAKCGKKLQVEDMEAIVDKLTKYYSEITKDGENI